MSKAPPIPPEQRAFKGQKPEIEGQSGQDDLQSPDPGNADVNLKEQGRHGNLRQNTSRSGNVQDR
ncbi:hypothetical protein ASD21_22520 [Caulobacter sp. Root1455]|jgi:hypothetical protein|uniref:hypothetical protein n=1 Tax=unclassified Caulobacter TaxID=2648921 RepID=UPI0006F455FC|nr:MULTISPECIES: hypothetical protein [unclassified Caulobacter]KQY32690.1 hypothetical protein ASD38_22315 [Caulobacter sp. Root487D2Y]KQZ00038.1 hypothetical protein ASD21_22520 [Caulobacter sp. Root1455]